MSATGTATVADPVLPTETVTTTLARWAAGLRYEDLGEAAVREARRFLLDSIGCAVGGYRQEDVRIALHSRQNGRNVLRIHVLGRVEAKTGDP